MEITLVAVGLNGKEYEEVEKEVIETKYEEIIGEDSFAEANGALSIQKRFAKEIRHALTQDMLGGSALFIPEELVEDGKHYLHVKNVKIECKNFALYAHSHEQSLVDVFIKGGYGNSLSNFKSHLGL